MFKIQCDKNFKKIIKRYFDLISIEADISEFSPTHCDICILRDEYFPKNFTPSGEYLLINSDDKKLINRIKNLKTKIISCGLSTRSTATLSSISEGKGVICLQRSLVNLKGEKYPQFEMPFELSGILIDDISVIMLIISALLCGADMLSINKINM